MMRTETLLAAAGPGDLPASRAYLAGRLRQEASAAARAASLEASLIHVGLAARYAERLIHCSGDPAAVAGESWVADHRLW